MICNHPVRHRLRPGKKSMESPSTLLPLMLGFRTFDKLPRGWGVSASRSMLRARVLSGVSWLATVINRSPKQFVCCEPISYQTIIEAHSYIFLSMGSQYLHNRYYRAFLSHLSSIQQDPLFFQLELIGSLHSGVLHPSTRWGCGKRVDRQ